MAVVKMVLVRDVDVVKRGKDLRPELELDLDSGRVLGHQGLGLRIDDWEVGCEPDCHIDFASLELQVDGLLQAIGLHNQGEKVDIAINYSVVEFQPAARNSGLNVCHILCAEPRRDVQVFHLACRAHWDLSAGHCYLLHVRSGTSVQTHLTPYPVAYSDTSRTDSVLNLFHHDESDGSRVLAVRSAQKPAPGSKDSQLL